MASPISFGDAYTMAKIAFRIGHAFTKGRRSAPSEFQEVENQLYSIGTALEALKQASDKGDIQPGKDFLRGRSRDPILAMLENCRETLGHLDSIVNEYGCLSPSKHDTPGQPVFKRWSKEIRINWRKIRWTATGGDLSTLRSQLTLHTNSLGLILAVLNNSRAANVQTNVSESTEMLRDIYEWFLANLKHAEPKAVQGVTVRRDPDGEFSASKMFFVLHTDGFVCDRASLRTMKLPIRSQQKSNQLFQCHCSNSRAQDTPLHHDQISAFTLSPLSYPIRLSGNPRSWMLYKVRNLNNNLLETVKIQCLSLNHMMEFEEQFAESLGVLKAREFLHNGASTIMAHLTLNQDHFRVLDVIGDLSSAQSVDSVTFASTARSFTQRAVASIKLLHYKLLPVGGDIPGHSTRQTSYETSAELVVFYNLENEDEIALSRTVIYFELDTEIGSVVSSEQSSSLSVGPAKCTGFRVDDECGTTAENVNVVFSFSQVEAAKTLRLKLLEMRIELWALSRQYPRSNETVVLQLLADEVSCDDLYIENAVVSIVKSQVDERYRLIIRSENGCTILSQELARDFFSSWSSGTPPNFNSRTDMIQMQERNGAVWRQILHRAGLSHLQLSIPQGDQLRQLEMAILQSP